MPGRSARGRRANRSVRMAHPTADERARARRSSRDVGRSADTAGHRSRRSIHAAGRGRRRAVRHPAETARQRSNLGEALGAVRVRTRSDNDYAAVGRLSTCWSSTLPSACCGRPTGLIRARQVPHQSAISVDWRSSGCPTNRCAAAYSSTTPPSCTSSTSLESRDHSLRLVPIARRSDRSSPAVPTASAAHRPAVRPARQQGRLCRQNVVRTCHDPALRRRRAAHAPIFYEVDLLDIPAPNCVRRAVSASVASPYWSTMQPTTTATIGAT